MKRSMKRRIMFGLPMLAALAGVFWLDWRLQCCREGYRRAWPLVVVFLPMMALGVHEIAHIAAGAGLRLLPVSSAMGAMVLGSLPFWWQLVDPAYTGSGGDPQLSGFAVLALMTLLLAGVFVEQMVRHRTEDALHQCAVSLLAAMYLGLGGAMILAVRMAFGVPALVLFVGAVKLSDVGAYFVGSAVGKHKLIPWLSPGKSWEGLAGAVAGGACGAMLLGWLLGVQSAAGERLSAGQLAAFGLLMALTGQLGDFCESLLKRSGNVKDSGALVPEFGGVLDMLDSPLIAAPFAYLSLLGMGS